MIIQKGKRYKVSVGRYTESAKIHSIYEDRYGKIMVRWSWGLFSCGIYHVEDAASFKRRVEVKREITEIDI